MQIDSRVRGDSILQEKLLYDNIYVTEKTDLPRYLAPERALYHICVLMHGKADIQDAPPRGCSEMMSVETACGVS
jgi:hypothetical protein